MDKNKGKNSKKEEEVKIYSTPDSTLQTPEEHQHDQRVDPTKDATMDVSNDDLRKSDIDKYREWIDGTSGGAANNS